MKTFNHRMTGVDVRKIVAADTRHARRVDGWHRWHQVVELAALAGALLALALVLEMLR